MQLAAKITERERDSAVCLFLAEAVATSAILCSTVREHMLIGTFKLFSGQSVILEEKVPSKTVVTLSSYSDG